MLFKQIPRSRFTLPRAQELCLALSTFNFKISKPEFFQTQLEAIQEHPSSLAIDLNISFFFFYISEISGNKQRASQTEHRQKKVTA